MNKQSDVEGWARVCTWIAINGLRWLLWRIESWSEKCRGSRSSTEGSTKTWAHMNPEWFWSMYYEPFFSLKTLRSSGCELEKGTQENWNGLQGSDAFIGHLLFEKSWARQKNQPVGTSSQWAGISRLYRTSTQRLHAYTKNWNEPGKYKVNLLSTSWL